MPGANVRRRSITARSSVMPCDLWIVIAHAQRNGTCLTLASTVSPSIISQEACFIVTILPFLELHDRPAALGFGREPAHRAD